MSNDQAIFNFELNESLYFETGQEVDEIREISLDPEISIQPFQDYISIQGVIELRGEYVKTNVSEEEQDVVSEYDVSDHAKRFVEQVTSTEDGKTEFSHRFPVEISVPSTRVENLDEVMVSIHSFDYELAGKRQLTFTSTIAIHGIREQEEEETPREDTVDTFTQGAEQTFDFDIKEPNQDLEEKESEALSSPEYPDIPALSDDTESPSEEDPSDRWKHKKSQSLTEFFNKEPVSDSEPETEESSSIEDDADSEQSQVDITEVDDDTELSDMKDFAENPFSDVHEENWESSSSYDNDWQNYSSSSDISESENETEVAYDDQQVAFSPQINENADIEQNESADVRYLSDMFRDEEEQFSRMRVCIVQEKETLEMIADRYDISTLKLIQQNDLDDDTISEGQLLYIPEKK